MGEWIPTTADADGTAPSATYSDGRLSLTRSERAAVEAAARIIDAYDEEMDGFPSGAASTLRGLLERTR